VCVWWLFEKRVHCKRIHRRGNFKIIDAQHARLINNYENNKYKLFKTKAAIRFSKFCRNNLPTQKYLNSNIKGNQRNRSTKMAPVRYRLNQERRNVRETCIKNKDLHLVIILKNLSI
jgi:hypothetical protein